MNRPQHSASFTQQSKKKSSLESSLGNFNEWIENGFTTVWSSGSRLWRTEERKEKKMFSNHHFLRPIHSSFAISSHFLCAVATHELNITSYYYNLFAFFAIDFNCSTKNTTHNLPFCIYSDILGRFFFWTELVVSSHLFLSSLYIYFLFLLNILETDT